MDEKIYTSDSASNFSNGAMMGAMLGKGNDKLMQGGMNNVNTSILSQGYQNQLNNCNQTNTILMQSQALQNTIQNGVTALGYQSERNSSATQQASTANTQRIIDTLNNHWNLEQQTTIQQLRDQIGRLNQTNTLISSLKGTATATSTAA